MRIQEPVGTAYAAVVGVATALWVTMQAFVSLQSGLGTYGVVFLSSAVGLCVAVYFILARSGTHWRELFVVRNRRFPLVMVGVGRTGSGLLIFLGFELGGLQSQYIFVYQTTLIISATVAAYFLKDERLSPRRWMACGLAIFAPALAALNSSQDLDLAIVTITWVLAAIVSYLGDIFVRQVEGTGPQKELSTSVYHIALLVPTGALLLVFDWKSLGGESGTSLWLALLVPLVIAPIQSVFVTKALNNMKSAMKRRAISVGFTMTLSLILAVVLLNENVALTNWLAVLAIFGCFAIILRTEKET